MAAGLLSACGEVLAQSGVGARFVVVTDARVDVHHSETVLASLRQAGLKVEKIVIPAGEAHKTLATFEQIIARMLERKCDRQTVVLALGGGVVGDLAGFVAATYMRGIPLVQAPTTLLAQVDASIGGKVGVNHRLGKNMIGAFHQPRLVLIDPATLTTLPSREVVAGLAEVVKHAVIADAAYFEYLRAHLAAILALDQPVLVEVIRRSCEIKSAIVSRDEREAGSRALLNFGHTIGHALEAATGFERLRHGEAVWLGMLAEAYISHASGYLSADDFTRFEKFLRSLPLRLPCDGISMNELEHLMARDKKATAGAVRMVMLQRLGAAVLTAEWRAGSLPDAVRYAWETFKQEGVATTAT
ncbi:MAG: 3-dehydroquinate synthase [candidate division KSB1 bacterium]|nr:3-dehydroquinate synthase [candidate division KSB1 bacterium]